MIHGMDIVHGMDLLYEFLVTALIMRLPQVLLIGGLCFLFTKGLLMFGHHVGRPAIKTITKLVMLLISLPLIIGLLYGVLRFSGVIMFPTDNTISWNWFDASWRDDGFEFIHPCGCALIGMALAVLTERKARRAEA